MPLYEYECERCGGRFEVIQRFSDAPVAACRLCAGPVHRLLSPPSIHFKGTGWYVTDYSKKGGSPSAQSSSSRSESEGESKPAATESTAASDAGKNQPATPSAGASTETSK